ncbi:MAG: RNA 2',3'-cyclic phosphodiesterase [Actinomycetota bacterium]|nr:RNA 2',3'-cyclic phosphodiesterase [Actinomycetota bacterium]
MTRLFLAIWPPEDVIAELISLPRKTQRGVRFIPPDNWHITLRFLGEAQISDVVDAMDDLDLPETVARLGPGVDALDERALIVPVTGLDALAECVNDATRHLGDPPRKRFLGHLTIARIKPNTRMPPAMGAYISTRFSVDEVCLVRSRLHADGARYETVETWPTPSPSTIATPPPFFEA